MEKILKWLPSFFSGVFLAIHYLINLPDLPNFLNLPIAVWFIFLLLIGQIIILQNNIAKMENTKPNVIYREVELETPWVAIPSDRVMERFYLPLINQKPSKNKNIRIVDTTSINAIAIFYDKDCIPRYEIEEPWWLHFKKPNEMPFDYKVIISASGSVQGLHLIIREQGKKDLYIFSRKSYNENRNSSLDIFKDEFKLMDDEYYISIKLSASNLEMKPIYIKLTNLGANAKPKFEFLEYIPCINSVKQII